METSKKIKIVTNIVVGSLLFGSGVVASTVGWAIIANIGYRQERLATQMVSDILSSARENTTFFKKHISPDAKESLEANIENLGRYRFVYLSDISANDYHFLIFCDNGSLLYAKLNISNSHSSLTKFEKMDWATATRSFVEPD